MAKQPKNFWSKYGSVIRSKNRILILKKLDAPKVPLQLAKETDLGMNMTSRALRELEKEGIIECKNPDAKVGRVYDLTVIGKKILKQIKD